jgi:hypothetical protein
MYMIFQDYGKQSFAKQVYDTPLFIEIFFVYTSFQNNVRTMIYPSAVDTGVGIL